MSIMIRKTLITLLQLTVVLVAAIWRATDALQLPTSSSQLQQQSNRRQFINHVIPSTFITATTAATIPTQEPTPPAPISISTPTATPIPTPPAIPPAISTTTTAVEQWFALSLHWDCVRQAAHHTFCQLALWLGALVGHAPCRLSAYPLQRLRLHQSHLTPPPLLLRPPLSTTNTNSNSQCSTRGNSTSILLV